MRCRAWTRLGHGGRRPASVRAATKPANDCGDLASGGWERVGDATDAAAGQWMSLAAGSL
jgi:hypothetical protein